MMASDTACAQPAGGLDPQALLAGYSLEMTARSLPALEKAAHAIPAGTALSITFLPGEAPADRVRAAAGVRRLGFVPVPHLAARRIASRSELDGFLGDLVQAARADRVFVVGGDPAQAQGPYPDALALIRSGILARHGIASAGIAGYPEGHPAIPGPVLWQSLLDKHAALRAQGIAPFIATQFGFEAQPVLRWLAELRARGIDCPVRIGVPGPARIGALLRYAAQCGVSVSSRVMGRYGLSLSRLLNTVGPAALIADLGRETAGAADGVALHFYAFGGFQNTAEWVRSFIETDHG